MQAISLTPIIIKLNDPVFNAITSWSFEDEFVSRMLASDIPHRVKYGFAQIRAYLDPQKDIVGFGILDMCDDCSQFTEGKPHTYVPLLAVRPDLRGRGHGKSIVNHLVEDAACLISGLPALHHAVFLDVYEESKVAINLYTSCGFVTLNGPIVDPLNGKNFFVMSKRVSS